MTRPTIDQLMGLLPMPTYSSRNLPLSNDDLKAFTQGLVSPVPRREMSIPANPLQRPFYSSAAPRGRYLPHQYVGTFTCNQKRADGAVCNGEVAVWLDPNTDTLEGSCSACFGLHTESGFFAHGSAHDA